MSGFVTLKTTSHGEVTINVDFILKIHPPVKINDLYKVTVLGAGGAVDYRVQHPLHHDLVYMLEGVQS